MLTEAGSKSLLPLEFQSFSRDPSGQKLTEIQLQK